MCTAYRTDVGCIVGVVASSRNGCCVVIAAAAAGIFTDTILNTGRLSENGRHIGADVLFWQLG